MIKKDTKLIPSGYYCYEILSIKDGRIKTKICPYWSKDPNREEQMNGYCSFLEKGDWDEDSFGLFWDQVKECGVNKREE